MGLVSREEIKTYIMANLGWPILDVELDDLQIGQAITTALDEYLATGAVERAYLNIPGSSNTNSYPLPKDVGTVANLVYAMPFDMMSGVSGSTDIFSFAMGGGGGFGALMGAGYGNFVHGAGNLGIFFEYMQNRNRTLGMDITFRIIDNNLIVYPYPKDGNIIIVEYSKNAYGVYNADGAISTSNQWGIYWIKRMALAISKNMLGLIRGKYSTIAGATGESQTLNAAELLGQAKEEILALRDELACHSSSQQFFIA